MTNSSETINYTLSYADAYTLRLLTAVHLDQKLHRCLAEKISKKYFESMGTFITVGLTALELNAITDALVKIAKDAENVDGSWAELIGKWAEDCAALSSALTSQVRGELLITDDEIEILANAMDSYIEVLQGMGDRYAPSEDDTSINDSIVLRDKVYKQLHKIMGIADE